MFIGHFAPAIVAATHPKAPGLGTLFIAGQLVDFGFFGLALIGIENFRITPGITTMNPLDLYDMPFTHSLLGSTIWALAFAILIWLFSRNRTGALIGGMVVLSHWFLDLLVHAPDLTLAGDPPKLGFGLWNYPAIAIPLELIITFGAIWYFVMKSRATTPRANLALGFLVILLGGLQIFNWFSPEPEAATPDMMIAALVAFTLAAIAAFFVGRTRTLKYA
ncbi:MAG: permease [Parasphingorhabdus sp.]